MKRILSVLLILIFSLALIPAASAAENGFDLREAADRAGEGWNWSQVSKTLTLSKADLQMESGASILLPDGSTVKVEADSSVTVPKKEGAVNADFYAVRCEGDLTLTGEGLLTIESGSGGISAAGKLTVGGDLTVQSEIYGLSAGGDLAIQAETQVDCVLVGTPEKLSEAIGIYCEENLTVSDAAVTVRVTDGVCGMKGKTVTVAGNAAVEVANENRLETEILSDGGIFSVNAIAGTQGITLEGDPKVTASVTSLGGAECVMAGQAYDSSASTGDLILNGGTLKVTASCTETAAFGLGGIYIRLNGGKADVQVRGSEEKELLSAALVAGKGGEIVFGEGMAILAPEGGYISHDGRMIVCSDGDAAETVSVSASEGSVRKASVSFTRELQWFLICLSILTVIAAVAIIRAVKEKNNKENL